MTFRFSLSLVAIAASLSSISLAANPDSSGPTRLTFIVYFASDPLRDPEAVMTELLQTKFAGSFARPVEVSTKPTLAHRWLAIEEFPPPAQHSVRYLSRDPIATDEIEALHRAKRAYLIELTAHADLRSANKTACLMIAEFANATRGYPWDDECRLLYTAQSWRKRRVDSWQGLIPDVRGEINMHAYRDPDLVRSITLGMRKYGLADLVLDQVPDGQSRAAGNTVNAAAQLLLEGRTPTGGTMPIDLSMIRHAHMRAGLEAECFKSAKGVTKVRFRSAQPDQGDPANRLWRLEFPEEHGDTATEKAMSAFHTLLGTDNPLFYPNDKAAMRAASERARTAFFANVAKYRKGFAPAERLIVKVPFKVPEGTEYMWVEVIGWKEDAVEGMLENDSPYDPALRSGKRVTVEFGDIYDYVHYAPDGTEEGNETGKVLDQQRK